MRWATLDGLALDRPTLGPKAQSAVALQLAAC
jgi:hypothetical protein